MNSVEPALRGSVLVAFGKTLARYDGFPSGTILRDVGEEILNHRAEHGCGFSETGQSSDLEAVIDSFVRNGFAPREGAAGDRGAAGHHPDLRVLQEGA